MITATYTDPFTGWEQRVKVSGDHFPEPAEEVWIADVTGQVARATADVLTEFHFEQGPDREYLPAWTPTPDETDEERGE